MTRVENFFIYWPRRHNLRPVRQFQQNYWPGKPPGYNSMGHFDRVWENTYFLLCWYWCYKFAKQRMKRKMLGSENLFSSSRERKVSSTGKWYTVISLTEITSSGTLGCLPLYLKNFYVWLQLIFLKKTPNWDSWYHQVNIFALLYDTSLLDMLLLPFALVTE